MGQPPCVRARSLVEGLPITLAAADRGQPGRQPLAVAGGTALRPGAQGAFDTQTDVTDAEGCRHATTGSMARESDWLTGRRRVPMRGADARGTTRECYCATVALAEADVETCTRRNEGDLFLDLGLSSERTRWDSHVSGSARGDSPSAS